MPGESPVRRDGIRADPDHFGPGLREPLVAVPERARLDRTPRSLVLGIEIQHERLPADEIPQPDRLAPLVRECEIRSDLADPHLPPFPHHHVPLSRQTPWRRSVVQRSVQCAIPPPPDPLLLCISSSSGSDSTKHAPNNRNKCSNDSIIACFVTCRLSTASAFASATGGGVPFAMRVVVMAASRSRAIGLNSVTFAASSARLMVSNRCSNVAEMAMPTLPPSCRIRLNSPVPFGIMLMGRSASARFVSGQKKSAMPLSTVK